jgi:hypothetical protein
MAGNEIGDYRCPDCQGGNLSFIRIRDAINRPSLPRQMIIFFCRRCRKEFEIESGTYIYQASLIRALKEKYP